MVESFQGKISFKFDCIQMRNEDWKTEIEMRIIEKHFDTELLECEINRTRAHERIKNPFAQNESMCHLPSQLKYSRHQLYILSSFLPFYCPLI